METDDSDIKVYGYYSTADVWLPVQVDSTGALLVTT